MKHLRRSLIVLLSGVSLTVMVPASLQAECLAVDFVYEHRDAMLAIKDPAQKNDYMRKAISSAWSMTSDTASKTIMAYGMGEGLATAPSRAVAEKALSLSHAEMLKLAKGAPVDQQRIAKTLSKIEQGVAVTDDLNIWMDRVGIAVDAINLIDWTITSMQTGDRYAKAKAAQSALSIARTVTAKVAGGTMGAMMASASFIDYAVSSFGEAAHAANWYNAYREYYDNGGRNGAFWVDLRERGGDQAVEAELNKFWDDPGAYANLQGKDVPRPFIGDALAIAKQKKAYAGRYMAERIEPMVAQETADRAEAAWEVASQEYRRACHAAKAEAQTLQTVETMLASLQSAGDADERLFFAVRRNDLDAIDAALTDGGDPLKTIPDQGYNALDAGIVLMISEGDGQDGIARLLASGASLDQAFVGRDQNPLTAALDKNAQSAITFLLKHGYPVDKPRKDGRTALMLAAFKGQQEIVTTLLSAGASVIPVDGDGIDALGYAANGSRADIIPLLISAGAQPNRLAANGLTPLIIAAARGNMATVQTLIDGGASPAMKGKSGTASHYASLKGHMEIAEYLKGLETKDGPLDIVSASPFQPTIISGNVEFIDLRVAKQTQGPLNWKIYIDDVAILGWRPRATSEEGTFSFEVVAKNEGTSNFTVRVTDAAGNKGTWSTRFTSELGYTELVERATEAIKSKDMAEIKKLASNPKTANILSRECVNWDQETMQCRMMLSGFALVAAIAANDTSAVDALLSAGVHADSRFASSNWNKGYSPMTYAVAGGRPEIARILVDAGANINHINPNGSNAFITALAIGRIDLARWLMQRGADVNVPYREDGKVYSALHIAATEENTQLFRELLQNGAQITTDDAGHTPGYYIYWLTKDVELAVAAGYPEAREYEAKANDPGFDWAEFARRMQPALQQFGQNVAAAQQQYNQRIADINDTYNSSISGLTSVTTAKNFASSPGTGHDDILSMPGISSSGSSTCNHDLHDVRVVEEENGERWWSGWGGIPAMVSASPCYSKDLKIDVNIPVKLPGISQQLYTDEESMSYIEQYLRTFLAKQSSTKKGICLSRGRTAESAARCRINASTR
ncbi:ankyrin repeat domain-containing protein [Thalassospira xiamenensis]|uniref:Ankyrin repeat n=1 Tax=Thalassospira xiamenensis TaxID=220697 RepID=A0A285TYV2_9PROT|nr:ankyrin repeat domain-containing protein [Thalassospira xiamenensis]SOC31298.1 Ankyrin repeat [Thalassospira xiamenensis]